MAEDRARLEIIKKYQWAGKIRFFSFLLLFLFLLLMRSVGGYSYLNIYFISLIFVEAILNQPYGFFLRSVNIYRFQFYQMITDIIAISWLLYYMGGIEAPLISIAYYAIILWAGVVSGTAAVFFAVAASSVFFSAVVISANIGLLPPVSYFNYNVPRAQLFSLVLGNLSFMFAFGYFCAHSSRVIRFLEYKRQQEQLEYTHKLSAAGYLIAGIAHDIINHLVSIRGHISMLSGRVAKLIAQNKEFDIRSELEHIALMGAKSIELLTKLAKFSLKPTDKFKPCSLNKAIEDALELTHPLLRIYNIDVDKALSDLPDISADKDQLQEVFVAFILNAVETLGPKGKISIKTAYNLKLSCVEVHIFGPAMPGDDPDRSIAAHLPIAFGIIERHKGQVKTENIPGGGSAFIIQLPAETSG